MTESMELFFFLRKDEHRPNDLRVVFDGNLYKVQWHHEPSDSWADEANGAYSQQGDAIAHALTKNQSQTKGYVRWVMYDEEEKWMGQFSQMMTHEKFNEIKEAMLEKYDNNLEDGDDREDCCDFLLDIDSGFTLQGDFYSHCDLCRITSADNGEIISEIDSFTETLERRRYSHSY